MRTAHPNPVGCRIAALTALLFCSSAFAEEATPPQPTIDSADTSLTIDTVIVTGARQPGISNVLTSVDVLGGSMAQRENIGQTFELFQRLPGILTTSFGQGNNNNGAISMRGFNGEGGINAVKLLVDGVPSNVNDGFAWMMDSVMPMDIAQVQVVRGTSDARYGVNNIAGNVSILTRQGGEYLDARAVGGSFGTYDGQFALGHESGDFSQNYFIGYRHGDGQRDHASSDRLSASGKWYESLGSYKIGLDARFSNSSGPEPGYLFANDAANHPDLSYDSSAFDKASRRIGQYSLHLDGQATSDLTTSSNLYLIDYRDSRFVRFAASIPQQEREAQQTQYGGMTALHYTPQVSMVHSLSVDAGLDFQMQRNRYQRYRTIERVRQFQTIGQRFSLDNYGAYVQAVIEPTQWLKITPAYRVDKFSGHFTDTLADAAYGINHYGAIGQPKISAAVTPAPNWTVYANYGRSFQVGLGSASYLIPPQTSSVAPSYNDGWETGVKYRLQGWLEARAAVWEQVASGELQFNELDSTFHNIGKTRRSGYDLQVTLNPAGRFSGWASFSQQKGVVVVPDPANVGEQAGNRIDHVPGHLYSAGADLRVNESLRFSATANGQSDYELDTTDSHGLYGGYFVVNAEAAWKVRPSTELSLQIKNIGDDRHSYVWWDGAEPLFAPADGRALYAGIRFSL